MTEKKQADMEGRGEGGIPKVKVEESYKKELLRNGLDAAENWRSNAGFSCKEIVVGECISGNRSQL